MAWNSTFTRIAEKNVGDNLTAADVNLLQDNDEQTQANIEALGGNGTSIPTRTVQGCSDAIDLIGGAPFTKYIYGLTLSNGTDSEHDIDITTGGCSDSALEYYMTLSSGLTKQLDAEWSAGSAAGGLFTGSIAASTWYGVFLIRKDADGAIDAGFDTSATAANIPAGYTNYRRIGWILTNSSSNIIGFYQAREKFLWKTPILDVAVTDLGTSAAAKTLSVPPAVGMANINVYIGHGSTNASVYLSSPLVDDLAPSTTAAPLGTIRAGTTFLSMKTFIMNNASSQIRARSDQTNTTLKIATIGWEDFELL